MAGVRTPVIKNAILFNFSRNSHLILRRLQINIGHRRNDFSTEGCESVANEQDPAPLFFDKGVQKYLKILTRPDPKKVFRVRMDGKQLTAPIYKFMTDEELSAARKQSEAEMARRLQIPPVLKARKPITDILSKNPEIQGHDNCKYIFTDITYGVSDTERLIVVREPNGLLRYANWDERFRMNQAYFPLHGRDVDPPKIFENEYLQDILKREEYEHVLDRACLQYEPNDPEYLRVTKIVYDTVDKSSHFDKLRSTRHYGSLVFYLVWNKNIDNLLLENIQKSLIEDAVLLIKLYNQVHPSAESAKMEYDGDDLKFIQQYAVEESPIRGKLISMLNAYKESLQKKS